MHKFTNCYELPCLDCHKSFYGKAQVLRDGNVLALRSYATIVCSLNLETGEFIRHWNGYSLTTMRHVNSFRILHNALPLNKSEWQEMAVIEW